MPCARAAFIKPEAAAIAGGYRAVVAGLNFFAVKIAFSKGDWFICRGRKVYPASIDHGGGIGADAVVPR